jgi:hypothetical protein
MYRRKTTDGRYLFARSSEESSCKKRSTRFDINDRRGIDAR